MNIDNIIEQVVTILAVEHPDYLLARESDSLHVEHRKTGEWLEGLESAEAIKMWIEAHGEALAEGLAAQARAKRQQLLVECDWSQLPDVKQELREAYAGYRQALRDIPDQAGFPHEIEWPVKP